MDIKKELIAQNIGLKIIDNVLNEKIDYDEIVQTNSLNALEEIKMIIQNHELNDFMKIEKIVDVFIKHNIDVNGCHDF